jgi:hypothetical protein
MLRPWSYIFHSEGHYGEGLSASYELVDSQGHNMCDISVEGFDAEAFYGADFDGNPYDDNNAPNSKAERIAKFICDCVNDSVVPISLTDLEIERLAKYP